MLTWLLDALLTAIPGWVWLVGGGSALAVYFTSGILSHFPLIESYAKFLKPVAGLLTLLCVFMWGGSGVQAMWEEKVRAAEEAAKIAEAKAAQLNEDLKEERKKKGQVRVEYRDRVKYEIREVAAKIDSKCQIDPVVIEKLNKAAKNPEGAK